MPSAHLLVDLKDVTLKYGQKKVLNAVSLSVSNQQIVTIIGPNGAGKSTLLRVLLNLQSPTSGTVWRRPKLCVGYMPQKIKIDPTLPLTVRRFLKPHSRGCTISPELVLEEVGATKLLDAPFTVLSGGELQRVLLARALISRPDLLVLDEPIQGVDVHGQKELYALITRLRDRWDVGVLVVSHDLHFVLAASDQVICLNQHVCCAGRPEVIRKDPSYLELMGGTPFGLAPYTHKHDHTHNGEKEDV